MAVTGLPASTGIVELSLDQAKAPTRSSLRVQVKVTDSGGVGTLRATVPVPRALRAG